MGISIKNDEVEAMIRKLAEAEGAGVTEVVERAVRDRIAKLEGLEASEEADRQRRIDETIARFRSYPVYDDRDHGDMLYDKNGLPK
jgi:hypothetical protein